MGIKLGDIEATLKTNGFSEFSNTLNTADSGLASFSKNLTTTGKSISNVGKDLGKKVTLPIVAIGTAFLKSASDAEEANAKFNTAFSGIEDKASKTSKTLAKTYGLSNTESEKLLGNTGDLLKGFGATASGALDFSRKIQELSVDLTSYNNVQGGASRVSNILTKSVLGNKDGLTELGASILDVDIKQELMRRGQEKLTGQAGKLAKAQAIFKLILEQTEDAQGDYLRTQNSIKNQTDRLISSTKDLASEFGTSLIPVAKDVVKELTKAVEFFSGLDEETKKTILSTGGIIALMPILVTAVGSAVTAVGGLTQAFVFLSANPAVLAIGVSIATIGTGLAIINKELKESKNLAEITERLANGTATHADKLFIVNTELKKEQKLLDTQLSLIEEIGDSRDFRDKNSLKVAKKLRDSQQLKVDDINRIISAINAERDAELKKTGDSLKAEEERRLKLAEAETIRKKADSDRIDAQLKVAQGYIAQNEAVQAVLQSNKTEIELIDDQIKFITKLSLKDSEFRNDQLEAIEILNKRKGDIDKKEEKSIDDKAKKELEALEKVQKKKDKLTALNNSRRNTLEKDNKTHLATLQGDEFAVLDASFAKKKSDAKELNADISDIEASYQLERKLIEDRILKEDQDRRDQQLDSVIDIGERYINIAKDIASGLLDIASQQSDEEIDILEDQAEAELTILEGLLQEELNVNALALQDAIDSNNEELASELKLSTDKLSLKLSELRTETLAEQELASFKDNLDEQRRLTEISDTEARIAELLASGEIEDIEEARKLQLKIDNDEQLRILEDKAQADKEQRIVDILKAEEEAEKERTTLLENAEIDRIALLEASKIEEDRIESEKALEALEIEKNLADEKYKIELKQFKADKALALASIVINTALGVAKSIPNVPLMIASGIAGLAQGAIVLAESPPAPPVFLASGGIADNFGAGVNAIIGEAGAEAVLPLTDDTFQKLGDSIANAQNATVNSSPGRLGNLMIIIEGMGELTVPITQDALDNGQLTVNASSLV